jgi:hypothetical protein
MGLELGNENAHGRNHGLDQRLRHRLFFCGVDTDKCFPGVIAEVCSVLADIVWPCCHLRPRCRHSAYVTLGNAHKFRLLDWPKGGLLDVVFIAQFQKFRSRYPGRARRAGEARRPRLNSWREMVLRLDGWFEEPLSWNTRSAGMEKSRAARQ